MHTLRRPGFGSTIGSTIISLAVLLVLILLNGAFAGASDRSSPLIRGDELVIEGTTYRVDTVSSHLNGTFTFRLKER